MGGGFGYRRPEQGHDGLGLRVRAVPLCQSICETQLMFSKKKTVDHPEKEYHASPRWQSVTM